jgi:hypothetical protein
MVPSSLASIRCRKDTSGCKSALSSSARMGLGFAAKARHNVTPVNAVNSFFLIFPISILGLFNNWSFGEPRLYFG